MKEPKENNILLVTQKFKLKTSKQKHTETEF